MKAITLTQPWATLVAIGAKRFETRSWRPHHLGTIAIHAAKGFPLEAQSSCYDDLFFRVLFGTSVMADIVAGIDHRSRVASLPRGAVIAIARLEWAEPTSSVSVPEMLERLGGRRGGQAMSARVTIAGVVLHDVCDECGGAGWLSNPDWQRWFEAGQPAGKEPRDGFGELEPEEFPCAECEGHGARPTEAGLALLELVRRWQGVR